MRRLNLAGSSLLWLTLYFQGHKHTGIRSIDALRTRLALISFAWMAGYLKALPPKRLASIVLNTCSLSPTQATIAHWADWSLHRQGFNGRLRRQPRLVFVKADWLILREFQQRYLPRIHADSRYILITGDSDSTIPHQIDRRSEPHDEQTMAMLRSIHDDPRLVHWYGQNLDACWPKQSPIPLGYWEAGGTRLLRQVLRSSPRVAIRERPLKAFCAHRIRPGDQWRKRQAVSERAVREWRNCVDLFEDVPAHEFFATISRYSFVICVGGGGLDPSPKAWTALLAGAIPVIERNATTAAYQELPVVFVDDWQTLEINPSVLSSWRDRLAPHFEEPEQRAQVLQQLSMGYWLRHIQGSH